METKGDIPAKEPSPTDYEYALRRLTPRELDVLKLAAQKHTSREMAKILGISTSTLDSLLYNLRTKLNINTRVGLRKCALDAGILADQDE